MLSSAPTCVFPKTNTDQTWPYVQYYIGEQDNEHRKNGQGQNYWTGAKSLECYSGHMVHDNMHGDGEYRWRYQGPNGTFMTYEGHLYNNQMHGYGSISYDDGRVFTGIFHGDVRWGPGVESHACVKEDVGLWNGKQLIRLCWRPDGPAIAPDLTSSVIGREIVKPHRRILSSSVNSIGGTNSNLELLKHYGANPLTAVQKCDKLYPVHCTDLSSTLFDIKMFENEYFKDKIYTLREDVEVLEDVDIDMKDHNTDEDCHTQDIGNFYAWNNSDVIKHMMKHCYKHEFQRKEIDVDLPTILSGPRRLFKPAAKHEINCRTLLMASYLGHIPQVTELIIENNVHPDVADLQGNTALMYATCGERADIIHFLVEAGANVNAFNDSCCTPLSVILIKLACNQKEIPANSMLQALLPAYLVPVSSSGEPMASEWLILRDSHTPGIGVTLNKSPSKTNRNLSSKKIKSLISLKDPSGGKKKSDVSPVKILEHSSDESFSEEKRMYMNINREYLIRVGDIYQASSTSPVSYIFEVNDMIKEVEASEDQKKLPDKNLKKAMSKVLKDATKPSKDAIWQTEKDDKSINSIDKLKKETSAKLIAVMIKLLSDGADPKLVTCPQPALFIAIVSGSAEAVRNLIFYGADVNEVYSGILGYRPLDIAISLPLTYDNLEIISVLLEHGAETQHRLVHSIDEVKTEILGPTLFHVVLARRVENEIEEEIRSQIIEFLLDYNCIPTLQFKGRSAIDIAMTKSMDIFDIFIRNPKTNLNSIINEVNQSVLVKMFHLPFFRSISGSERLQKITDLLLYGANPLKECQNGEEKYGNFFAFARKTLNELEGNQTKSASTTTGTAGKQDSKNKKGEKPKKDDKISARSVGKMTDDLGEYKQAIELVTECARLLYIRWLQANLVKELLIIIKKYNHRHWNMILKEVKHKKYIGLWLTPQGCVDICNILSTAKNECIKYGDRHILKHLLSIVQFCSNRINNNMSLKKPLTTIEKGIIEKSVNYLLYDQKKPESFDSEVMLKRCYVKPELISKHAKMFNVCFECALPLCEDKITCTTCKLIAFCSFECMQVNGYRTNCHPCSDILKDEHSPNNSNGTTYYNVL